MGADGRRPKPGAAFFDLDKTLIQGSSAFQFGRAAYRAGLLGRRQLLVDALANLQFRLRGATDADSLALRERIAAGLEGKRVVDMERLGADVLAGILPRVYPEMLALAHAHQDAGRRAYIVTAASQDLADILARVMALDGGIGSQISEVVDGVYTGRPAGVFVYRGGKAEAIEQLAEREGIDLSASYAYSDSESDLPMLEAVGHPVAVNPDGELRRIARRRGWDMLQHDRLRRRLGTVAALGAAAGAGGIGSVVLSRRMRPRGGAGGAGGAGGVGGAGGAGGAGLQRLPIFDRRVRPRVAALDRRAGGRSRPRPRVGSAPAPRWETRRVGRSRGRVAPRWPAARRSAARWPAARWPAARWPAGGR